MAASGDAVTAANLADLNRRIGEATQRAGRAPGTVRLVAVSKTFGPDAVRAAAAAGQSHFGENRVQEAERKMAALADLPLDWHLIGHLQSNKARKAVALFNWIHSIDSLDVLRKVDVAARELGRAPAVLLQVDLAGEASKSGAALESILALARAALECSSAKLVGLMTIPPIPDEAESSRRWFIRLREARDRLVSDGIPATSLAELSMGMSQDFEVAIEEGATLVRVGTAIFGDRSAAPGPA